MMSAKIFVNLKRFDVPVSMGGVCQKECPKEWAEWIVKDCVESGLAADPAVEIAVMFPESLVIPAAAALKKYPAEKTASLKIGCQGVFRQDVAKGGNFGAFTTNKPAAAVKNTGADWAIIGHSEERKDKFDIIAAYDGNVNDHMDAMKRAKAAVDRLINEEAACALKQGIKVLLCVGESAEEKGEGEFEVQKPRIEETLKGQLQRSLNGLGAYNPDSSLVIGYEPIWAIGPGKVPPGKEYIEFVSKTIKRLVKEMFAFTPHVVYGGGLKEENAAMIASIDTIDGGLIALTRFAGDIGFYPDEFKKIVENYLGR